VRRRNALDVALDFLACGLDPERTLFFRQSDVPEVTELTWLLSTVTPMGCSSVAPVTRTRSPRASPQPRPVLLSGADGGRHPDLRLERGSGRADQKQHVEVTRDIAIKFNEIYGQTFVIPEPRIREEVAVVPGLDGQKMSKSYGNTIEIFGEEKAVRKQIMSIKMDSRTPQEPKPDADQNLAVRLLKLVAPPEVARDFEDRLRAGGLGYGDLKKALFQHYWEVFAAARARRAELAANLDHVHQVLIEGAARARALARDVLDRARRNAGL
jgi:tryptophanyl-tRNA synthetase